MAAEEKFIEITFPNGGEHLVVGSVVSITWESSPNLGNLLLEYSANDGSSWFPIIGDTPNDGRYEWTVPSISTALARVRASEVTSPIVTDRSDGFFTIAASEPELPSPSAHETVVLSDPLLHTALGQRTGGQFTAEGGWQVTGSEDMIVYDLGRYIENGSFEIELRNFNPENQNTLQRHHVMSMYRNPWGNHNPAEDLETVWDFHTGFRYDPGIKLLSWTLDQDESSTKVGDAWEADATYQIKIVWEGNQLQYFRDGVLEVTHRHSSQMQLRYLFLGRDFTVSGDLVTEFKNNQYPSMVGPIYSNLVVKEFFSESDQSPPLIEAAHSQELYANGAKLRWTTREPAESYVEYGLTSEYGQRTTVLGPPESETTTTLTRLQANTIYHYRIVAVDHAGNKSVGPDMTFRTLPDGVYVYKPTADTFVEAAKVFNATRDHANFGWMSLLTSHKREAYLRFQISGLDAPVSKAYLRLHARQGGDSKIKVQTMATGWSEGDVTWRTKPDLSGELHGVVGRVAADDWVQIAVNSAIHGDGRVDFALIGTNSELVSFDSRESPNDQPELIVFTGQSAQAPQILSFSPMAGGNGTEITINGSHFQDAFRVAFGGLAASSFSVESDNLILARVPFGARTGKLSVTTLQGAGASAANFEVTESEEPITAVFTPTDDSFVRSSRPTESNGTATDLRVRKSSADRHAYLKFKLSGLSEPIRRAVLRLYVLNGSEEGGTVHVVSNKFQDKSASWTERTLTWENAPDIDGTTLKNLGSVKAGKYVEINLASVVKDDGTYSFGIKNRSSDLASYSSKEGSFSPELVVVSGGQVFPPKLTSFTPINGLVGDEITIFGENLQETSSVSFDGTDVAVFSLHSDSELRVVVPTGASSGALTITNAYGSSTSSTDFEVLVMPVINSFEPSSGRHETEVTIVGENLDQVSGVLFNETSVLDFSVESATLLKARVPSDATTGKIILVTSFGSTESQSEFTVIEESPGEASTLNFFPTDDSFVRSTRSAKNYGNDDELRVRRSSSTEYYSYMKFHVQDLIR
ncbi:DNRLRE domain-containing protein, partial [bacterium]|nr:DNRLRE domain-containing protein [bacterium]